MSDKPRGSGLFAVAIGAILAGGFLVSLRIKIEDIEPQRILQTWLVFASLILIGWGIGRMSSTSNRSFAVGQDTMNWAVSILAATFVVLAFLGDVAERKSREHGCAGSVSASDVHH